MHGYIQHNEPLNVPIMIGRYFRIACVCLTDGSSEFGGCEMLMLAYWLATSRTGSAMYLTVVSHPSGGAPSTKGSSHDMPCPLSCCSMVEGPPNDGTKKKPSFRRPSDAARVSALHHKVPSKTEITVFFHTTEPNKVQAVATTRSACQTAHMHVHPR